MTRKLFPVSCKAALFTPDRKKVLIVEYDKDHFGLPGGHIEEGEEPDQAMRRELEEELGLENVELKQVNFLLHPDGRIILGYHAVIAEATRITLDTDEVSQYHWVKIKGVMNKGVDIGVYRKIVAKHKSRTELNTFATSR